MFVTKQIDDARQFMLGSQTFGGGVRLAMQELIKVGEEGSVANWDGYGAEPISRDTFEQAYRFLYALPIGLPAPSVSADPGGEITFEWHKAARRTLSVSITPQGDLHYAALLGASRRYGTERFALGLPQIIQELIVQVIG